MECFHTAEEKLYGEEQPAPQSDWVKQKLERGK